MVRQEAKTALSRQHVTFPSHKDSLAITNVLPIQGLFCGDIMNPYKNIVLPSGEVRGEHRVVMEEHLGRRLSSNEVVHHKNGNQKDNRLSNLELMSRSDHAKSHVTKEQIARMRTIGVLGAPSRGVLSGMSKLSEMQVLEMRKRFVDGERVFEIAKDYPVCYVTVRLIVHDKRWKHLTLSAEMKIKEK